MPFDLDKYEDWPMENGSNGILIENDEVIAVTDKALLLNTFHEHGEWFPRSQLEVVDEEGLHENAAKVSIPKSN